MAEALPFIVVLVEHDSSEREKLRVVLRQNGYAVLDCGTGAEARRVLNEYPWDLAIIERSLPDTDGAALCQELRQNPEFLSRYLLVSVGPDDDKVAILDQGADDYVTARADQAELLAKIRAGKRIVELSKRLIALNKQLELLSITDGLTKLYNRRYFQEQVLRAFEQSLRYQRPLSVGIIDVDLFKQINDTHGHGVGDRVLEEVSNILAQSARLTDQISRYGGDEFALIAPETNREEAWRFCDRIRTRVEETIIHAYDVDLRVTVSIGVMSAPEPRMISAVQMIDAADKALYKAKRTGRNRVQGGVIPKAMEA